VAGHRRAKGVSRSSQERRETVPLAVRELSNGDIYVGSTDDLRRRLASRQSGQVVSTSKYFPTVLRSYVAVADKVTARRLERYFKSGSDKVFAKKRFLQKSE